MIRSRSIFEIDLYIVVATVALLVIGVLFVFSSGVAATGQIISREYVRQIIWATTGLSIMFVLTFIDYRVFYRLAFVSFGLILLLLVMTLLFGRVVSGARRWIGVWEFGAQPSEFAKLALILVLARFYSNQQKVAAKLHVFVTGFLLTMIPTLLVLMQPDLGTAMVYLPVFLVIAFFGGARPAHILFVVAFVMLTGIFTVMPFWDAHLSSRAFPLANVLTQRDSMQLLMGGLGIAILMSIIGAFVTHRKLFLWMVYGLSIIVGAIPVAYVARYVLRDYQIMRLVVFIDPYVDPQGAGWNIIQSITAVGSGGPFGKGFLQGTQSHYQYLPAQSTDFIFSILAEEWGFVGVLAVFLLFGIILGRGMYVMALARDRFASLIVAGILTVFVFHFTVNVGMTIGIMPITGLPLYLLSFGGSSIWTALAGLGLIMSIYQHRYQY